MQPAADRKISHKLSKHDKLKSPTAIENLYRAKQIVFAPPLKCFYQNLDSTPSKPFVQAAFAVPKRIIKLAVARNYIKRIMREAYRKQYREILENCEILHSKRIELFFLFVGKQKPNYETIEVSVAKILKKIAGVKGTIGLNL